MIMAVKVLTVRFLAGRYGTVRMNVSDGLSGDATASIQRRVIRAAKVGILMMGFCIGRL